ncbi:MAG: radical SAM protein [Bdellovibrionales bacterium]|nr:radical SAM protein [Bdellovibrionales bacterium]
MRWNYQKYGRETVYFTDSLVNGSVKMFRELCATLADFRATGDLPDTFSWTGHFICHREGVMKEADYRLMKESGCSLLHIGIESGSERVRDQMGKKFSNRDIDICMEMLAKHQMSAQFLMIIGYPTETESDFQDTLRLFQKLHCLGFTAKNADGYAPLKSVSLGSTMLVDIHDEGVWKALSRHGIDNYQNTYHWSCGTNTHTERKERMKRARACLQRLKIDEPDEAKRRQDEIDNIPKIQKKRNLNQTLVL